MIKRMCSWTRSEATSYVKAHQAIVIQHTQSWNHITLLLTLILLARPPSRVQTVLISPWCPSISSCIAPQDLQTGLCKQWLAEFAFMASCVATDCASLLPVFHRCLANCTCRCHAELKVTTSGLYIVLEYPEAHITSFVAD